MLAEHDLDVDVVVLGMELSCFSVVRYFGVAIGVVTAVVRRDFGVFDFFGWK